MSKIEVTLVILAVKPFEDPEMIRSFVNSGLSDRLFPQFVYMTNTRQRSDTTESQFMEAEDHELMIVTNDRYFGSCEENAYRSQDFLDVFKPYVFIVGEHDIIDWEALYEGLTIAKTNKLDAMGWNILVKQAKPDGTYFEQLAVAALNEVSPSNEYAKVLLSGHFVEGSVGFPAMLATYGPIDWAAYIGNQVYTLEAYRRLLQYKLSEHVYSFVYKQAMFFRDHKTRYGFFMKPVIHRISEDFMKLRDGTHKSGWLEDHRTVQGNTPTFWCANLLHLYQLEEDALFHALATSLCLTQIPAPDHDGIGTLRMAMLVHLFGWSKTVLENAQIGKSYYFPDLPKSELQDVRYVKLFFSRLLHGMETHPTIYHELAPQRNTLIAALSYLDDYLHQFNASKDLLRMAAERLNMMQASLTSDQLINMHRQSFAYLLNHTRN